MVSVTSLDKRFRAYAGDLERTADRVLSFLKESRSIEIYLIGNSRMRSLNKRFRGKSKSTNVLSFRVPEDFPVTGSAGEIYLCPPYIRSQSEDMRFMLVHGILHLFGFNHDNKSDRMRMEKIEKNIMQWLNPTS